MNKFYLSSYLVTLRVLHLQCEALYNIVIDKGRDFRSSSIKVKIFCFCGSSRTTLSQTVGVNWPAFWFGNDLCPAQQIPHTPEPHGDSCARCCLRKQAPDSSPKHSTLTPIYRTHDPHFIRYDVLACTVCVTCLALESRNSLFPFREYNYVAYKP